MLSDSEQLGKLIINTTLDWLFPYACAISARRFLFAVGWQESRFVHRLQIKGPARGFWQFEPPGLEQAQRHGRYNHIASILRVPRENAFEAIAWNDWFACAVARLLVLLDPKPIPENMDDAWLYYLRLWRPGRPRPEHWEDSWDRALTVYPPPPGSS